MPGQSLAREGEAIEAWLIHRLSVYAETELHPEGYFRRWSTI